MSVILERVAQKKSKIFQKKFGDLKRNSQFCTLIQIQRKMNEILEEIVDDLGVLFERVKKKKSQKYFRKNLVV